MKKSGLAERLRAHVGGYIPLRLRDHEVEGELNCLCWAKQKFYYFYFKMESFTFEIRNYTPCNNVAKSIMFLIILSLGRSLFLSFINSSLKNT